MGSMSFCFYWAILYKYWIIIIIINLIYPYIFSPPPPKKKYEPYPDQDTCLKDLDVTSQWQHYKNLEMNKTMRDVSDRVQLRIASRWCWIRVGVSVKTFLCNPGTLFCIFHIIYALV